MAKECIKNVHFILALRLGKCDFKSKLLIRNEFRATKKKKKNINAKIILKVT